MNTKNKNFVVKTSSFLISCTEVSKMPQDDVVEFLLVGRSNVGKSSLINYLLNRKKIAYTSSQPGKTQLLNFFEINNGQMRLVDAPGYGYANQNLKMRNSFAKIMEDYFQNRSNLKLVCLLIDLRHPKMNSDLMMINYLRDLKIPYLIIGTKLDKLKKNDILKNQKSAANNLLLKNIDQLTLSSSVKKIGYDKIWTKILSIIKNN